MSKRDQAAAKLAKCRLLDASITVAICADHREAGCASAGELKASWKHLKRRSRQLSKERDVQVTALPLQCVDVCKFGPLMSVTPTGQPATWLGQCTPDVIDTVLDQALSGQPLPNDLVLDRGRRSDA